jgi:hypothetical protein
MISLTLLSERDKVEVQNLYRGLELGGGDHFTDFWDLFDVRRT